MMIKNKRVNQLAGFHCVIFMELTHNTGVYNRGEGTLHITTGAFHTPTTRGQEYTMKQVSENHFKILKSDKGH